MGLPMYVSPSIPKRQLPSKQPTSPPYTPQTEESYDETFQNGRTNIFDIPESQTESLQRSQRSRRSSSLPYNLVQQHIHRLHQLHQLHRTREQQQHISPNLASRRGLNSVHHLSLNHRSQIQHLQQMQMAAQARRENNFDNSRNFRDDDSHDEMFDLSFDDFVTSLDNNNNYIGDVQNDNNNNNSNNNNNNNSISSSNNSNNNNDNHNNNNNSNHHYHHHHHHRSSNSSSVALDNVIRRVNLLRQISQQQEIRNMRSSSRHHRSSTGHSSGRSSSRTTSQNANVDRRRDDLIQRGIDIHPSRHPIPDTNLLYEHSVPFPPVQRLSAWHTRRGVNWSTVDPPPVQRTERRSSFADDFYSEIPHQYESDDHHLSRIISPIPRRYDSRFSISSLPIGNDHGLLLENNNNNNSSNNRSSNNDSIGTGSAAGGVC